MQTAYATYLALAKQANLFINAERSPLLSKKLLDMRLSNFVRQGGTLHTDTDLAMMGGGYATMARPGSAPEVHHLSQRTADGAGIPSHVQHVMTHHELDEVAMGKKYNKYSPLSLDEVKAVQEDPSKLTHYRDRESVFGATLHDHNGPRGPLPIGHVDPAVILRESNRVAHQVPDSGVKTMVDLRRLSADQGQYTFPYGRKYIPEGGREFESQRRVAMTRNKPILTDPDRLQAFQTLGGGSGDYAKRRAAGVQVGKEVAKMVQSGEHPTAMLKSHYGKTLGEMEAIIQPKQANLPPYCGIDTSPLPFALLGGQRPSVIAAALLSRENPPG